MDIPIAASRYSPSPDKAEKIKNMKSFSQPQQVIESLTESDRKICSDPSSAGHLQRKDDFLEAYTTGHPATLTVVTHSVEGQEYIHALIYEGRGYSIDLTIRVKDSGEPADPGRVENYVCSGLHVTLNPVLDGEGNDHPAGNQPKHLLLTGCEGKNRSNEEFAIP
jgi:hypothetical protein